MRFGHEVQIEKLDDIGGCVVKTCQEVHVRRNLNPSLCQCLSDIRLIEQHSREASIGFTRMTTTRSTIESRL